MKWRGDADVKRRMQQYGDDCKAAIVGLAEQFRAEIEADAKVEAPWEDRTANARQTLFSEVESEPGRTTIYLSHEMDYGVYLELNNDGRYAIILPTLEKFYPIIQADLKELFR
jgi:hypothetical protein